MKRYGIAIALLVLIVILIMIGLSGYVSRFDDALYATMTAVYRK